MAWKALLLVSLAKLLNFISWPSFIMICPLYASFWAMEIGSQAKNQQCLTFWVLFAFFAILEHTLAKIILWLPFWPYVKGISTLLLVIPYFRGASYIYKCFFRTYALKSSQIFCLIWNVLFVPTSAWFSFSGQKTFVDEIDRDITLDEQEEYKKTIICQGEFIPNYDHIKRDHKPIVSSKVQKEWSCAVCLISTPNEKCLKKHLRGKKHKAKEEERAKELASHLTYNGSSLIADRNNGMILLGNLVNLERLSGLIRPIARSTKWCKWKKPDVGWIKLNTDGSIDREKAGFGGLLRDHKGDAICAFVSKAPLDDIFLVELWAIWRGLILALRLGIKVIWVESDSMSVVKTINGEQHHSGRAYKCLKHIWTLLKKFEKYLISHSWRETNKAADYLSRMVLEKSDVVLWPNDFPDALHGVIKDDARGRLYCRR